MRGSLKTNVLGEEDRMVPQAGVVKVVTISSSAIRTQCQLCEQDLTLHKFA